eukprot:EG_transcript_22313
MSHHDHAADAADLHDAAPQYADDSSVHVQRYSGLRTGYEYMWDRDYEDLRRRGRKPVPPPSEGPHYDAEGRLVTPRGYRRMKGTPAEGVTHGFQSQLDDHWQPITPARPCRMKFLPAPAEASERPPAKPKAVRKIIPHRESQLEINAAMPRPDADVKTGPLSKNPRRHYPEHIGPQPTQVRDGFYFVQPPWWTEGAAPLPARQTHHTSAVNRHPAPSLLY